MTGSCLHRAAWSGGAVAVRVLVAAGAPANARDGGDWTPLMCTACCDSPARAAATAQALLTAGADWSLRNRWGKTALDVATARGRSELAALLRGYEGKSFFDEPMELPPKPVQHPVLAAPSPVAQNPQHPQPASSQGAAQALPSHSSSAPAPASPDYTTFLEKWKTVKLLGSGAFGDVHEVLTDKDIRCATKTIRLPVQLGDQQDKNEREINKFVEGERNLCHLIHPNIVRFLQITQRELTVIIFMELLEGESLGSRINGEALGDSTIRSFATQICSALCYLHRQDPPVIHRDINCSNIIVLSESNRVKLIDFGLSIKLQESFSHHSASSTMPKDTLYFMSPELLGSEHSEDSDKSRYSRQSDIWAFGCTVYQMATGTRPHSDCRNLLAMALSLDKQGAPSLPDGCSRELKNFYSCCVARDRKKRKSAAELMSHEFLSPHGAVGLRGAESADAGGARGGFGAFLKTLRPKKH